MKTYKNITLAAAMAKAEQITERAAKFDFVLMKQDRGIINKMVPMYILRDNGFASFCEHEVTDEEIQEALDTIGALHIGGEHQMLMDMNNAQMYFEVITSIFYNGGGLFNDIAGKTGEIPEIVDTALMFFMDIVLHPSHNYFDRAMRMTGYDMTMYMEPIEIASNARLVDLFRKRHYGEVPQIEINNDVVEIVTTAITVSDIARDDPRYGYMYAALINGISVWVSNHMSRYVQGFNIMQRTSAHADSQQAQFSHLRFTAALESGVPLKERTPHELMKELMQVIREQADQNLLLIERIVKSMK